MSIADQKAAIDAVAMRQSDTTAILAERDAERDRPGQVDTKKLNAQVVLSYHRKRLLQSLRRSYGRKVGIAEELARSYLPERQVITDCVSIISPKYLNLSFPASRQPTHSLPRDKVSKGKYYWKRNHYRRNKHYKVQRSCYMPKECKSCFRCWHGHSQISY